MTNPDATRMSAGANQHGVRDHNERLILSMIQRLGPMSGSEIAKQAGLSPQTVSVILRYLETDGVLIKGEPQRGRVGKPSTPMALSPDAAFAVGLKIGRRSADFVLTDIMGNIRSRAQMAYGFPQPPPILDFLKTHLAQANVQLGLRKSERLAGIGIAMPFEIWNWHDAIGAPPGSLSRWQGFDLIDAISDFTGVPVFIENDATAACRAELSFGHGRELQNFAYFYLGSFIGGGLVLNGSVYDGANGNAGAFGSLPASVAGEPDRQLIDAASIYLLEDRLGRMGIPHDRLWAAPLDWSGFEEPVADWIADTARHLARSALTVCAVIDFEAIVIDGAFPADVKERLVERTRTELGNLASRGIIRPRIEEGLVGPSARALGASSAPILARFFLRPGGLNV